MIIIMSTAVTGCVAITHAASCLALYYALGLLLLVRPFFTKFLKILAKIFWATSFLFSHRVKYCDTAYLKADEVGGAIDLGQVFLALGRGVGLIGYIGFKAAFVALEGIGCKIKSKQVFICAD